MSLRLSCWSAFVVLCIAAKLSAPALADDKSAVRQQEKHFEKEITVQVKLDYLLYLPQEYEKEGKSWPLVLFLHGAGESGQDLNKVKVHGPPKLVAAGKEFPFIVVSPQSPGRGWDAQTLNALLDDVMANYRVDKDRIYVTGLSMGGFGTWALAAAYPDRFAALVPICGGGNSADAKKLVHIPIWVFHGAKDNVVPPSRSESIVKALKEAGAKNLKFTLYPDANHDSWTETYNNPEMWDWLLQQKRAGSQKN
jgi:predicted peptidase